MVNVRTTLGADMRRRTDMNPGTYSGVTTRGSMSTRNRNACTPANAATNTNSNATHTSVHRLRKAGASEGHPAKKEDSLHHGSASNLVIQQMHQTTPLFNLTKVRSGTLTPIDLEDRIC
jgi:hypothetical protein